MNNINSRRQFVKNLAATTGTVVLAPAVSACGGGTSANGEPKSAASVDVPTGSTVPTSRPNSWDPIAFNRSRGNAGAIPETYHASINGPDGDAKHLGKHLPYIPALDPQLVPPGFVAIMWGDPSKGHAQHPNAPKNESNNHEGHWYNWIRVRAAVDGDAPELESEYSNWPTLGGDDSGKYVAAPGGEITDDDGRATIYLAALPEGVASGSEIRIHAHCLTHGEYVDFLRVP